MRDEWVHGSFATARIANEGFYLLITPNLLICGVEEQGYIEIKIDGQVGNKPLKPIDIDITEIREIISDVETFLYPKRADKAEL